MDPCSSPHIIPTIFPKPRAGAFDRGRGLQALMHASGSGTGFHPAPTAKSSADTCVVQQACRDPACRAGRPSLMALQASLGALGAM